MLLARGRDVGSPPLLLYQKKKAWTHILILILIQLPFCQNTDISK